MPAAQLFRLWGRHFGENLVEVEVESPLLSFEGAANTQPAAHDAGEETDIPLDWLRSAGGGASYKSTGERSMVMELDGFKGEAYPPFANIKAEPGQTYSLSFEARTTGDPPDGVQLGLGLMDSRGWDATHSGNGIEGLDKAKEWKRFSGDLTTLPDCPGLKAYWRVLPKKESITAKVEIRDIRVVRKKAFPPYAVLTAAASVSENGETLYLIVFNKHHEEAIDADIALGSGVSSGRLWTVAGPSFETTNLDEDKVTEVRSGDAAVVSAQGTLRHTFPPRSMTAFEFEVKRAP